MASTPINDIIESRISEGKGRGIFARKPIPANTLLLHDSIIAFPVKKGMDLLTAMVRFSLSLIIKQDKGTLDSMAQSVLDGLYPMNATSPPVLKFKKAIYERATLKSLEKSLTAQAFLNFTNCDRERFSLMFAKLRLNAFSGGENDDFFALAQRGSLINHSCVPNALYTVKSDGATGALFVVSNRDIKEGEEVFINYTDFSDHETIRDTLRKGYFFECACEKCRAVKNQ